MFIKDINYNDIAGLNVGAKALHLIHLALAQRDLKFRTPRFSIIMPDRVAAYRRTRTICCEAALDYFQKNKISHAIKQAHKEFYVENEKHIVQIMRQLSKDTPPVIRTSLTMDRRPDKSFAGVNWTQHPMTQNVTNHLRDGLATALAGTYRPYSEWYIRKNGFSRQDRDTAILLCDRVSIAVNAIAYLGESTVNVVFGTAGTMRKENFDFDEGNLVSLSKEEHRIAEAILDLKKYLGLGQSEIEFVIDPDGYLHFTQYRHTTSIPRKGFSSDPVVCNLLSTPGDVISLRKEVDKIAGAKSPVLFLVNYDSPGTVDSYALSAYFSDHSPVFEYGMALGYETSKPPTHIITALNEDANIAHIVEVPKHDILGIKSGCFVKNEDKKVRVTAG